MEILVDRELVIGMLDQLEGFYLRSIVLENILKGYEQHGSEMLKNWKGDLEASLEMPEFVALAQLNFAEQRRKVLSSLDLTEHFQRRAESAPSEPQD